MLILICWLMLGRFLGRVPQRRPVTETATPYVIATAAVVPQLNYGESG